MTTKSEQGAAPDYYLEERVSRSLPELRLTRIFFPDQQTATTSQMVLYDELRELALIGDSGVAMTKIGWWHEEWQRLMRGVPRHPVTIALMNSHTQAPVLEPALTVLAGMVSGSPPADSAALQQWLDRLAAPLAALEPGQATAHGAWRRIWLLGFLADLKSLVRCGRAPWPLDLAAATQLVREQIASDEHRAVASERLWQAFAGDSPEAGCHAQVFCEVRQAVVLGATLGQAPAGLWRQLWVAWRATRRARRAE